MAVQGTQKNDDALVVHDGSGQQHEARHGNDDNASSLQTGHEPVGGPLPCQGHHKAQHKH